MAIIIKKGLTKAQAFDIMYLEDKTKGLKIMLERLILAFAITLYFMILCSIGHCVENIIRLFLKKELTK